MECRQCGVVKLSSEFPPNPLTDDCVHPRLYCIRCTLKFLEKRPSCPHETCGVHVDSDTIEDLKEELDCLFPPPVDVSVADMSSMPWAEESVVDSFSADQEGYLTVTLLNGDEATIPFHRSMKVDGLKQQIQQKLGPKAGKQKLLWLNGPNVTELKSMSGASTSTLARYGVKPGSTIQVLVQLCEVPLGLEEAIFDLSWGYPDGSWRDYLDASALVYKGGHHFETIDFSSRQCGDTTGPSVHHSGDRMDDQNRRGHHTINVKFQQLPKGVTKIYFVLSAWDTPEIAHFKTPSLHFYDKKTPEKMLCKNHVARPVHYQAVIMCYAEKDTDGQWAVNDCRRMCRGNAKDYDRIKLEIARMRHVGQQEDDHKRGNHRLSSPSQSLPSPSLRGKSFTGSTHACATPTLHPQHHCLQGTSGNLPVTFNHQPWHHQQERRRGRQTGRGRGCSRGRGHYYNMFDDDT